MSLFHERLKYLRIESNVLQKGLADMLNVSPRAFRNYENGTSEPTYDNLIKLADYFEVSLDYLVGRSEDPTRH